jgi:translation initiation factor 5B
MTLRKLICVLLGHVDHGKTSLLDTIRNTAVASRESGGITQSIGCSSIPINTIQKISGSLLKALKLDITIPGLLFIDSPGHAAFASLRKRGGSLADIAILVVDINEGLKPQTIESIEILKANKVPFIIAANKVDLIHGWKYDASKLLMENISNFNFTIQGEFEKKLYELVGQIAEYKIEAGQGIPELLMVLTGLAQKYLEQKLEIKEDGECKGTILEVKDVQGLGTTIDAIIYNGKVHVNDTLVIGGIDAPLVVKVRALLEPANLSEMRDKKSKFQNVKEVRAATGVKISAPGLQDAISGMPIRATSSKKDIGRLEKEVQQEVGEVLYDDSCDIGVAIKADTIGGLEALRQLLTEKNVPISSATLGDVTKKDLSKLESMKEKDPFAGVLLGFNVTIPQDVLELISIKKLKIITHNVIYTTIEEYEKYTKNLHSQIEMEKLNTLTRPCKCTFMPGYIFRQSNPAIIGVDIEVGTIKTGDNVMNEEGKALGTVKSMKDGADSISIATKGKQIPMGISGATVGRHINEGDFLYTDIPEEDFKKLKTLTKHLTKLEIEILKQIAEIKRKDNPVWGVG